MYFSSSDSGLAYDTNFTYGPTLINNMAAAGFTSVQIMVGNWINGSPTYPGTRALACRPSTAINWVYRNASINNTGKPFCGTGNSGGAGVLVYGLAHYGLGSIFSMIEPTSGPPMGDIRGGCLSNYSTTITNVCGFTSTDQYDTGTKQTFFDSGFGSSACSAQNQSFAGSFAHDSEGPVSSDALLNYPATDIHQLFGSMDTNIADPQGTIWFNAVTSKKANMCVAGAPHGMADVLVGEQQIESDLKTYCKLQ